MAENKIRENTLKPKPEPVIADETADAAESKKKPADKPEREKKDKKAEKPKKEKAPKEKKERKPREKDPRYGYVAGFLLLCFALFLTLAFISFFVSYFSKPACDLPHFITFLLCQEMMAAFDTEQP